MITTRTNEERFRLLGLLRSWLVQEEFEALYAADSTSQVQHLKIFQDYFEGFMLSASEIGLEFDEQKILPHADKHDQFAECILENTVLESYLPTQIADQFGDSARFNFMLAQSIVCLRLLGSFKHGRGVRVPAKRQAFVKRQMKIAHEGISAICELLKERSELISEHFGAPFGERCEYLCESLLKLPATIRRLAAAYDLTEPLLNELLPNFGEI